MVLHFHRRRKKNNLRDKVYGNHCGENRVGCGKSRFRGIWGYKVACSGQGDYLEMMVPEEKTQGVRAMLALYPWGKCGKLRQP